MNSSEKLVVDLVRKAFCSEANVCIPSGVNWMDVIDIATRQGVMAIAYDGIQNLLKSNSLDYESIGLTIDDLMEWMGQTAHAESDYENHRKSVRKLADFYQSNDIKMLLMKGYGLSLSYPVPNHRPTGDIDVYLFGSKDCGDVLIEQKLGIKVEREYHKHSHFQYGGFAVENHAKFIDDVYHKSNIRYEKILEDLIGEEPPHESNSTPNIYLPSPTWNALFLLRHAGEHFATNEITLRHVLDLGTFFVRYSSKYSLDSSNSSLRSGASGTWPEINWPLVLQVYKQENIKQLYDAIATICVEYLGFKAECFVGYTENKKLAERVLEDIFSPKDELPMSTMGISEFGKVKYGWRKTMRWWQNRWKYRMVYNETLWESFSTLALNRIKN